MKIRAVPAVLAFLAVLSVLAPAETAAQTAHAYALLGRASDQIDFLDVATVQLADNGDKVEWVLSVDDPTAGKISYTLVQYEIACGTDQLTIRFVSAYDAHGNSIHSGAGDGTVSPVIPGSLGDLVTGFVCKGIDPFPDTATIPDTNGAIAAAQTVLAESKKPQVKNRDAPAKPDPIKPAKTGPNI